MCTGCVICNLHVHVIANRKLTVIQLISIDAWLQ